MWTKVLLILSLLLISLVGNSYAIQIPNNLLHCYRGNETRPWTANTFQLLVELIRKIEDANPTSIDIRTLSVNILHRLRLDGIARAPRVRESEFVTPYRANGIMAPKFQLLLELISETPGSIKFDEFLTPTEVCELHRLISSSVEPYERGDESRVCPMTLMTKTASSVRQTRFFNTINQTETTASESISRCPLELGIIRSFDYGTFSPGVIIASIAAGLQPQNVRINELVNAEYSKSPWENLETMKSKNEESLDKLLKSMDSIDNTYAAGIAGDLAEVCVYQGPILGTDPIVGLSGTWNNSHFPRHRYLTDSHKNRWEFTDTEILAGIDGLYISQQIESWIHRIRRIRLSQIFDMFYSARGIPTLAIENANRRTPFTNNIRNINVEDLTVPKENTEKFTPADMKFAKLRTMQLVEDTHKRSDKFSASDGINSACNRRDILKVIDKEKLKDETYYFSQVLQYETSSVSVSDEILRRNCDATVDKFFEYAGILLDTVSQCNDILSDYRKPTVDLNLILSVSRNMYENLQLVSYMAELIDVSSYGSTISVVHGQTGQHLINRTHSVSTAFQELRNFNGSYSPILSLSRSLGSLVRILHNQTYAEQRAGIFVANTPVLLIFSIGKRITQADFESAKRLIHGSLAQFPDLHFVIVTDNIQTFNELFDGINRKQQQIKIINTNVLDLQALSTDLLKHLKSIPKRIIQPFCEFNSVSWRLKNDIKTRNFFEDYASPNQELRYRISSNYLVNTEEIRVEFQGVAYGELTICLSRDEDYKPISCKSIKDFDTVWFNISRPCETFHDCDEIYFSVLLDKSNVRCTENDCRYPDQVRFIIKHEGLRCVGDWNSSGAIESKMYLIVFLLIFIFNIFYLK